MSSQIQIPKNKTQAENVIRNLLITGKRFRNPQAIRWWIAHWYMRGARNFSNINYQEGTVQVGFVDDSGILRFQYEEIVSKYQTQLGRLQGLDLAPAVDRKGISLDGLRKASIAQAALDAAFPEYKVAKLREALLPPLLLYGTVGLGVWTEDVDSIGIDVIPPWEILPIPPDVTSPDKANGKIRRRLIPKQWLKDMDIVASKSKAFDEMETTQVLTGQLPAEVRNRFQGASILSTVGEGLAIHTTGDYPSGGKSKWQGKDDTMMDVTELAEIWTETPDHYLAEYLIYAGGKLVYRTDHTDKKIHMPIQVIQDIQIGGFWGRSFVDLLIPLNTEIEYTASSVFQTVQDFEYYGLLMEPTTMGVPVEAERGKDGIKRLRFEPDYTVPDLKPFNIPPANPGPLPWRALQLGMEMMDKLANQPTKLTSGDAPGRVDSSTGLGLLYEFSSVPLSPTAKAIGIAMGGCYKSILGLIQNTWKDDKLIDITQLDDALAGIKLDASTGQMSLAENSLPHPDEVNITINSEVPKSKEQQKMELKEALQIQIITPTEYRIEVRKRGLSLPVGNPSEWQNYRRAMLENLILFGDGKTPGKNVIYSERDIHIVHIQVLDAFMARPEFYLAQPAVRDAFVDHHDMHEAGLGKLPDEMPYPEDAAEEAMAQEQGGMGGGMPDIGAMPQQ